jgi:hypothetical protein
MLWQHINLSCWPVYGRAWAFSRTKKSLIPEGAKKGFWSSKTYTPSQPLGPTSLLFSGYRGSFQGLKRPGRKVNHSIYCQGYEYVELYLHSPYVFIA